MPQGGSIHSGLGSDSPATFWGHLEPCVSGGRAGTGAGGLRQLLREAEAWAWTGEGAESWLHVLAARGSAAWSTHSRVVVSRRPSCPDCRLDELNLSWCFDFTEKHVQVAVAHVSETVTQLNLSGYRKNLQRSGERPRRWADGGGWT